MYFEYGENEITYLRNKDKKLSAVIDQIGMIERKVDTDLFSAVVHHIIGQQISTKAQATIWQADEGDFGRSECCNYSFSGHFQVAVFGDDLS